MANAILLKPPKRLLMNRMFLHAALAGLLLFSPFHIQAQQPQVSWDGVSLLIDGRRVTPVMGEIHYSRLPANEWPTELRKMKEGGVTMVATYVFWNHVEEIRGQFDWSGQRDLRRFLELCRAEGLPVVLRLGPFCHGEVRCGGIPDWAIAMTRTAEEGAKPMRTRSTDPRWLELSRRLYRQIFTQVQGLQWKDGGPVVAVQFDNEYRGSGDYLMALKQIALEVGFDLPFYTRTGWPELSKPVPFGEMLPLYGDYADGFWERSTEPTAGNYWKAFFFKANRDNKSIGSEQLDYSAANGGEARKNAQAYPFFTCELGGGMATAYHRRPYLYPEDALAMAIVKLGSGSNLLGYYMYHGGTNPEGKLTTLNEHQATMATNYNDMPVKSYDFQAPLGEFGERHEVYYRLRPLHLFLHDFGEQLAPMTASYLDGYTDDGQETARMRKGDDGALRWSYRAQDGDPRKGAFVFFNNYERLQRLSAKNGVRLKVGDVTLPKMNIPAGAMGVLPVNVAGMRYATAQLVAQRDGCVYLMQIPGMAVEIALAGGKVLRNVKPRGPEKAVSGNIYLLTRDEAEHLFLEPETAPIITPLPCNKVSEAGPLRQITMGAQKVAEEPTEKDFDAAAVYTIDLQGHHDGLLQIDYRGDVARLYADGKLIDDNFYNGRLFCYGLWRLPEGTESLQLRILPMQQGAPIYYSEKADTTQGEAVKSVVVKLQ